MLSHPLLGLSDATSNRGRGGAVADSWPRIACKSSPITANVRVEWSILM
jgi:hypothetical protein